MAQDTDKQEFGLMTMEVPLEVMAMLRRVQADPDTLQDRAAILNMTALFPRGKTDESELAWRRINYKASQTILAMAGGTIDKAVEGGIDSRNCNPTMFLVIATMLSAFEVRAFTNTGE